MNCLVQGPSVAVSSVSPRFISYTVPRPCQEYPVRVRSRAPLAASRAALPHGRGSLAPPQRPDDPGDGGDLQQDDGDEDEAEAALDGLVPEQLHGGEGAGA